MSDAVPVAPSLEPMLDAVRAPREDDAPNRRTLRIAALAIAAAFLAAVAAQLLTRLIGLITNVAFYGRWSMAFVSPADNLLGMGVVVVPVIGAVLVGLIARYGSAAIRGHGIPEAMEQVLLNESRISPKVMFLKPLSAAISIGTGGPFGAEGPIIATGGALGSVIGQLFHITADERKTLLAAGAAAGMAATFGVDPRIAALVGMAAIFAGASHAVLASVIFAFETTRQPLGLLPLLAGCSAAYLVSLLGMRHSIMTEKLARRGTRIRSEYAADFLDQVLVREIASTEVVTLPAEEPVEEVRDRIAARTPGWQHQGFPVLNAKSDLVGVVTRRDLLDLDIELTALVADLVKRPAVVIYDDCSAREAADHMVRERVGRLPVVSRSNPRRVIGIVSRSDLLEAHERRLHAHHRVERTIDLAATLAWVRPTDR